MTEVAGEVADGLILHSFTTERYVREVTMPSLEAGFAAGGRSRADFELSGPIFVVTGTTDEEMAQAATATKQQIAFYGSTPGYRGVLELHGWGEIGEQLNAMSKRGEWVEMGGLITDEMLDTFAVVAPPDASRARCASGSVTSATGSASMRSTASTPRSMPPSSPSCAPDDLVGAPRPPRSGVAVGLGAVLASRLPALHGPERHDPEHDREIPETMAQVLPVADDQHDGDERDRGRRSTPESRSAATSDGRAAWPYRTGSSRAASVSTSADSLCCPRSVSASDRLTAAAADSGSSAERLARGCLRGCRRP